jgi:PAT family beta-lactamase induction signal transducer AmpG
MSALRSRRFMFLLFFMLYFVQGVITSYQLNFFKPHMASEGIDADRIGLVASLALLPFIIKFIFGLLSDRVNLLGLGYRVPYMVLGVTACAVAFFGAFFVDPSESFAVLAAMVLTATFAMALFDTTADGFAVETIPPEDHSRVQSIMTGGRAAGLIILSFVFGILADRFGFNVIFLVIAAVLFLPLLLLFRVKEPAKHTEQLAFDWRAFGVMKESRNLLFGLFLVLAWFTFQGIDGLVTFYLSDELGASATMLGNYGTIQGIGMVIGAGLMSIIAARRSLKAAALTTLSLVSVGGLTLSMVTQPSLVLGMGILLGVIAGLHWTVYATLAMGITDLRIASSMFALFQMMANIGIAAGEGVAASLSDNIGFVGVFRLLAVGNLFLIPLFLVVISRYKVVRPAVAPDAYAVADGDV